MDKAKLIELARKAQLAYGPDEEPLVSVVKFAELVQADERERNLEMVQILVEAEREACAQLCDRVGYDHEVEQGASLAFDLATAIRARGKP